MRRLLILLGLIVLAGPALAQDWRQAAEYDVLLTSYDIQPEIIRLKAGEPVRLRFVNDSNQRHDFSARAFFRAALLRGDDADLAPNGSLTVAPLSTRTIVLVPRAGRYKAASRNRFQRLMGMRARIVVE
jgi:plastocyanin